MCWNCGCKVYDDDMGDARNLTTQKVTKMAQINGQSFEESVQEIQEAATKVQPPKTKTEK